MNAWLHVENAANEKLIADAQTGINAFDVFFYTRTFLLDAKRVACEVGIDIQIFPDVVAQKDTWRGVVEPLK